MAITGSLAEIRILDLVQLLNNEKADARVEVEREGERGTLHFVAGEAVHAELGPRRGRDAFDVILTWQSGSFSLKKGVSGPERTMSVNLPGALLTGGDSTPRAEAPPSPPPPPAVRKAKPEAPSPGAPPGGARPPADAARSGAGAAAAAEPAERRWVRRLVKVAAVAGVLVVGRDGLPIARSTNVSPEEEGALAAFLGRAGDEIGTTLGLGMCARATLRLGSTRLLLTRGDRLVWVRLSEGASVEPAAAACQEVLA